MSRLFLALLAGFATASWVGITLVELHAWSATPMVLAFVAAFAAVLTALSRAGASLGAPVATPWAPLFALLAVLTLVPPIDTTLLSQDASLHRASGRLLARTGSLGLADSRLEGQGVAARTGLYAIGSLSPQRVSWSRLPGGIVVPDVGETVAYPSFSHLLAVWIALTETLAGPEAISWLGPAAAFFSFWAVALLAGEAGGALAAGLAVALLASWLPQHFFARFLMPEIITQALVWGGVFAIRTALRDSRQATIAALVGGLALGASAFARLEQVFVFVPALLAARALLPIRHRILPGATWVVFIPMVGQALYHLVAIPTDYGNRILFTLIKVHSQIAYGVIWVCRGDGYCAGPILKYGLPIFIVLASVGLGVMVVMAERRMRGRGIRRACGLVAALWLGLLAFATSYTGFPVMDALGYYLPGVVWAPVLAGAFAFLGAGGLELAILFQALDQIISGRVSPEQIWASRRLVPVVLPMLALMATAALVSRRRMVVWLARGAIALALLLAIPGLRLTTGAPLQAGGQAIAARIAAAVPAGSLLVIDQRLDWSHLAAAIWLGEGAPQTYVLRESGVAGHAAAVRAMLEEEGSFHILIGEFGASPDDRIPSSVAGFALERVATFPIDQLMLEASFGRAPERLAERSARLVLYRVD
ncbi:MAG: hypothetical protein VCC00_13295 [Deltaproteobacteria bacterium]